MEFQPAWCLYHARETARARYRSVHSADWIPSIMHKVQGEFPAAPIWHRARTATARESFAFPASAFKRERLFKREWLSRESPARYAGDSRKCERLEPRQIRAIRPSRTGETRHIPDVLELLISNVALDTVRNFILFKSQCSFNSESLSCIFLIEFNRFSGFYTVRKIEVTVLEWFYFVALVTLLYFPNS